MIERIIAWSLRHRAAVIAGALAITLGAIAMTLRLKLDALPDVSDTQVIIKLEFAGQPPQLVEDQATYPLTAALLGVPGAVTVRAYSMFGEAFVYVVFADGVDPLQARTHVLERLGQLNARLPPGAQASLGPDASGTGWIYQYAIVARHNATAIDRLRALQDFVLKPELQSVPGVAEVATFGGMARQLQVDVDAQRLQTLGVSAEQLAQAVRDANQARGGGAIELGRQRFAIAADARLRAPQDLLDVPIGQDANGGVLRLRQVANVSFGPAPREGVGDLDGHGDVVGGIVVMRQGENAAQVAELVKQRLAALRDSLPAGVELVATYDRSTLIGAAVRSLASRLAEEGAVVALVCVLFLGRARSALVAIVALPIGLLAALALLSWQGITANIMSLGGLAIAIGAMIDAAVVMVEALHRKLEQQPYAARWQLVAQSAAEVGPALFFSLLVVTLSFLPVLSLQGQEGRLFAPLALTKTWAMAAAALLSITLVPVLMGLFIRGPVKREHRNALNRWLKRAYRPALKAALARPVLTVLVASALSASLALPLSRMGSEFMPPLDEGDLLYMPTTLPSVSVDEAADILRRTDQLIRAMPEVESVHGKAGRSDSATDPAPLSMIETTIRLKPREQWPQPMSTPEFMQRLDEQVRLAGLSNAWGYPIRTRIDMLSTGVKTALALRIAGPELASIQRLGEQAEQVLQSVPGVRRVFAEQATQGRFIEIELDRARAGLHGVSAADVTRLIAGPIGGMPIDVMSTGRERTPIVVRFTRADRASPQDIAQLRVRAASGATVALGEVAAVRVVDGPTEVKSENARPVGYVLLDVADADIGRVLARAQQALQQAHIQQPGYTLDFVGQYLRLAQARTRLLWMSAATVLAIVLVLYVHFGCWRRIGMVLGSLPVALSGALWFCHALGFQWSFATAVGCLALAGVAAEFCVVMLLYLDQAVQAERAQGPLTGAALRRAVVRGALSRLRPKTMTVAVILGGLAPLLVSDGVGVDVMRRIAAPMVGGMVTAPFYSLLVIPALYRWVFAPTRQTAQTATPISISAASP